MTMDDEEVLATGTTLFEASTSQGQPALSVAIIARDEARYIGDALVSAANLAADVLVLLDNRTTDETADIAQYHGAQVVAEPWRGFSAQRNRALDLCRGEWVLFLDADERVTAELAEEIQAIVREDKKTRRQEDKKIVDGLPIFQSSSLLVSPSGYWIPRHNQFFGITLRGGGWYPDYQLRLLRRADARYDENHFVHEYARLASEAGYLQGHLEHINNERFSEFWQKQRSYAIQEAQTLYREGRRVRWRNFIGAPAREFARRYVQLGGWRDGRLGLLLCASLAYFEFVKFVHLKALFAKTRRQEDKKTRRQG